MPCNICTRTCTLMLGSWEWKGNRRGEFSFSYCWDLMRIKNPEWPFYSITWFPNHCSKLSICLVRAIQGKLLTRHFLKNLGIIQDHYCVLCLGLAETIDHLYFQCPFFAYLWKLRRLKLEIISATGSPVLNIIRVAAEISSDISFFACCQYDMEKSFAISFAAKNDRYLKYRPINCPISADKSPDISSDMK